MSIESAIVEILNGFPPGAVVVAVAMFPVIELRGAIPFALLNYSMNPMEAYALSVFGNLLPVLPLLLFLEPVEKRLRSFSVFDKFFESLFSRTRKNAEKNIQKYGALGLAIFVAVPLPATGAWTGAAAAYIFGIKHKYSFPAIVLGVLAAGIIVTLASLGLVSWS